MLEANAGKSEVEQARLTVIGDRVNAWNFCLKEASDETADRAFEIDIAVQGHTTASTYARHLQSVAKAQAVAHPEAAIGVVSRALRSR